MSAPTRHRSSGALVIGGDYKSLGIVRSLGRHGIPVWVLTDDHLLAGWSRYAERSLPWPAAREADQVAYLLDLARTHALEGWAIFPNGDETAALLARNRQALGERYRLTIQVPWDTLRWAYDKRLTYQLAGDLGVDHPRTSYPRDRDDVVSFAGGFPAILKPAIRVEMNRFTIAKAWRVDDLPTLVTRYDEAAVLIDPSRIMIQELVEGGGDRQYSFAALCREGVPLASIVARRTRQWPMDFGRASTYVESIDEPEVERTALRILAALRFDGIVEIEFKRDPRDGNLKLLDINPRVWGWHTLGARAGVDFPHLLWRAMNGESFGPLRGRPGVRWVRALTDVPTALGEIRAGRLSVVDYLGSLKGPIEWAIAAADDPLPAILELPATAYLAWTRRDTGSVEARPMAPVVGAMPGGDGSSE
ncbi:MAG TPA: ATP-grasp domain-containing protein [Candidatus Limnocylindria bacterium]|nr:ATP-grasp domain-containing protein [Candidatus Limnocylindria bacterium]